MYESDHLFIIENYLHCLFPISANKEFIFNIGYGSSIFFDFLTSLHIRILLECGLLTSTVGNPHCDMLAGRIKPASVN